MPDPEEGVAEDGTIRTGTGRDRIPPRYEPVLDAARGAATGGDGSLYVYGSVANGTARPEQSDVDLLTIGAPDSPALAADLTTRFAGLCRGVEIATAQASDLTGDSDEAYGFRVFLRHYCVHLAGPDPGDGWGPFPADIRAARGFNGDLARHLRRWRGQPSEDPVVQGVRVARKTLLALAGIVSIHDHTWTTDRLRAVRRWSVVEPSLAEGLAVLHGWSERTVAPHARELDTAIHDGGVVPAVVNTFTDLIGLWPDD